MRRILLFVGLAVCSLGNAAQAQIWDRLTNPQVTVTLTHPPYLGMKVDRVAFGPIQGQCSDQFLDAVIADFVNGNVEVIDRQHLETLLAEHKLSLSGYVDKQRAAEMGKILGPSVLLFLKVLRCDTLQKKLYKDSTDFRGNAHRTHISKTEGYFKASIQSVDLTTGRVFAARTIDATPSLQNESMDSCCPEFPSEYEVQDLAQRQAVEQIHRMFFPWSETKALYFFDDKDCNLKAAFQLLRGGDQQGALELSQTNLEACRGRGDVKPKVVAHAVYNVGMASFILGHHDKALEYFAESAKLGGGNIVAETIAECRRAQQLATEMQRVEERVPIGTPSPTTVAAMAPSPVAPQAQAPAAPAASTVEERLKKLDDLLKKGLITKAEYDRKRAEVLKDL